MLDHTLHAHYQQIKNLHLRDLFADDAARFSKFSLEAAGLFLDYSKNRITEETRDLLCDFARHKKLSEAIKAMFLGEKINETEGRAVLHTALRNQSDRSVLVDGEDVMPEVRRVQEQMKRFSEQLHTGEWRGYTGERITDVVNIGIGGSDLGPRMVVQALTPYHQEVRVHFVSNVDASDLLQTLRFCAPERTLFLIASKSFTTQETMTNAHTARKWFMEAARNEAAIEKHFIAISTNEKGVQGFGIAPQNIFRFEDWVGGRFSVWSAIGLSVCCSIGYKNFEEFLRGAYAMDTHFQTADFKENMPVLLALLGVWYNNFFGATTQAVLPYDEFLGLFPAYLQQTDMESNGKRTNRKGETVNYATGAVVWGQAGTNGQHAFYQLIHQGTQLVPCDFILPIHPHHDELEHHRILLSHGIAQTEAMMNGRTKSQLSDIFQDKFRVFEGNIPTNTILVDQITPYTLGSLMALYEHKIFVQGILWDIFSFDQWGVELGKELATAILPKLKDPESDLNEHDSSTKGLIQRYLNFS
ncbi:MAG: glucose-6-phosphate isomerase [Bacteroidota bacterium]